jgi:hypothetical protein
MKTKTNYPRFIPRWEELADTHAATKPAVSPEEVWVPTAETFLSTLLGCTREEAENHPAPAPKADPVATRNAVRLNDIAIELQELITKLSASPVAEEEPLEELAMAPHSRRSAKRPTPCRGTHLRSAADRSKQESVAHQSAPASAMEQVPKAKIEEVRVAPESAEKPALARWTFMKPAIVPCAADSGPAFAREEAPAAKIEKLSVLPAPDEIVAATAQAPTMALLQIPPAGVETGVAETVVAPEPPPASPLRDNPEPTSDAPAATPDAKTESSAAVQGKREAQRSSGLLSRMWSALSGQHGLRATKQLRVAETVSLGEKRFVAVVHVDGRKFLIGGGTSGVALLTQLKATPDESGPESGAAATQGRA